MAAPPGDRSMNRRYLPIAAAALTLLGLSAGLAPAPRLLWNASQSAPAGLYRIDPGAAPVVGDWVAIAPPADLAAYMARRNYLPRGVPLLKRSEEHTSELQSLMRISYAVFCCKKKTQPYKENTIQNRQYKRQII